MADITATTAANLIQELWSARTIDAIKKNLVMAKLVDDGSKYVPPGAKLGDTIHIPHVGGFTAELKTAGVDLTAQANTESTTAILIDKQPAVYIKLENFARALANPEYATKLMDQMGYALAKKVDDLLAALYSDASTTISCGAAISFDELLSTWQTLADYDAPDVDQSLVLNPYGIRLLYANTEIKSNDYSPMNDIGKNGLDGRTILGIGLHKSTNIATAASSGTTTYHGMHFQKEAMALVVAQELQVMRVPAPKSLAEEIAVSIICGVKTVRPDWLVDFTYTV